MLAVRADFLDAMARTAAAVTVVTTDGLAGRFGQTVSAATSVTADPPTVLVCLFKGTAMADALLVNGCFAVNVLAPAQRPLADTFAGRGTVARRYVFGPEWRTLRTGSPIHPEVTAVLDCQLHDTVEVGTHLIVLGRVVAALSRPVEGLTYRDRGYGRHVPIDL